MSKSTAFSEKVRSAGFLNTIKIEDVPFDGEVLWLQHHFAVKDKGKFSMQFHRHTFWEWHAVLEGTAEYLLENGLSVSVPKGTYLLFPPNVPHAFRGCTADYEKISLAFSLTNTDKKYFLPIVPREITPLIRSSVEKILYLESRKDRAMTPFFGNEAAFILHLLGLYSPKRMCASGEKDRRFEKAVQFIRDNRNRPVSAKEAASFVHLSERQLCRLFLSGEGLSLSAYIRKERCQAVKERLSETEQPLREIAEELSFSNEYNLIRFFRREEGMSPGAFRRAIKP
ncbi:MAG: helix-turn-helix domain-containing protein [Clostridia bacterium]|nr:helix-turn-helix domain-containing protein [Clostridia bacterium]